jgi:hypothetical protein
MASASALEIVTFNRFLKNRKSIPQRLSAASEAHIKTITTVAANYKGLPVKGVLEPRDRLFSLVNAPKINSKTWQT